MRRLCNETERAIGVTYCADGPPGGLMISLLNKISPRVAASSLACRLFAAGLCHGCMSDPCSSVANELYMHDGAKSDYYFREQTYVLEAWK